MTGRTDLRVHIAALRIREPVARRSGPPTTHVRDIAAEFVARDLAISTARVPDGSPVTVTGQIEAGVNDLDVTLRIRGRWEAECRRCLDPVDGALDLDVHAVFVEDADEEAETWPIEGDWIDLAPLVREELLLALPLAPLCRDECAGPDPERFAPGSAGPTPASDDEPDIDPRWAALAELDFDEE